MNIVPLVPKKLNPHDQRRISNILLDWSAGRLNQAQAINIIEMYRGNLIMNS